MNPLPRRRFLQAAATFAAAAALAPRLPLASAAQDAEKKPDPALKPKPKRTLKKAVGLGMVGEGATVLEKFQLLKDLGFEGVEVDRPDEALPLAELKQAQEKTGIRVHGVVDSVHWSLPLNSRDAGVRKKGVDGLVAALDDAAALGAVSVLLVPAVVNGDLPYDEAYARSQEAIREVLPHAAQVKVKIAVENVWNGFLLSPLEAARYVDELKSEWAAFHFDVGNVVTYGRPEQWIRILGKRIAKLHIKDYSNKKRDEQGRWKGFEVELGEGDAGYAAVMAALDEVGFSTAPGGNWATAEVGGGDRKRLAQIAGQMDRLFSL
ncbi:MAG TPA: sugar phosphate isomerase/epimerase family protein [Planctomycetota bacterium]|jgi:hexulose-6-phosphate isomerase|nr:sugar phosphate isomerase/epimerase family protein [Planctomycetota bacterium]